MSVLVVGLSHKTAPVDLLERVAIPADHVAKALNDLQAGLHVVESAVLSTCNRVEVYAHVTRFHGGVQEVSDLLSRLSGVPLEDLSDHLYVHYEERAVQHLFAVASGLDSMVVGEGQILGQVRGAFKVAQDEGSVSRVLGELFRHSLRVGKRVRTETAIGRAGASLVGIGLRVAQATLGPLGPDTKALIVGAGSMGALAGTTLRREGVTDLVVANRTADRAAALAGTLDGRGIGLDDLAAAMAGADLVISSTGASGLVIEADAVRRAVEQREGRPLFLLDLALPRDVDPAVREIPGVRLADLDALRAVLDTEETGADLDDARDIVAEEVMAFLAWQRSMRVAPTVVALRAKADALIAGELERLTARVPDLDARSRTEVETAVRRVVDKLLHAPTVRVKELAESPGGDQYAEALRELFMLDPQVAEAVIVPDEVTP
ncbi:MAG TPA: glutamyl-tRNA reductase [Frankiaceae bacterium]|nr:glutamyl-tRNA reductase [Frankiaceae bacterium]